MNTTGHNNRGNGVKPVDGLDASSNGRDTGEALAATGRNGHGATAPLLRLLSLRARATAEPGSRVLSRRQLTHLSSWEDLQVEIDRSRRYGHSFSIVRLTPERRGKRRSGRREAGGLAELERRAVTLDVLLRRIDRVWIDEDDVYILLPDGDRAMAEGMLDRISVSLSAIMPDSAAAVATFPKDGLSKSALLASLARATERKAKTPSVEDDAAPAAYPSLPEARIPHAAG